MQPEPPDKRFYAEVRAFNLEFLALLSDRRCGENELALLGLDPGIGEALRTLTAVERGFVADAPGLLAGFAALPCGDAVGDAADRLAGLDTGWREAARIFATGLLTYLSQLVHRDVLATSLCLGVGRAAEIELDRASFRDVLTCSALAAGYLRARFAGRSGVWRDLLRTARCPDERLRQLCRLTIVPLGLAGPPPPAVPRRMAAAF